MKRWTLYVAGAAALVVGLVACPQFAPDDVCGYPGFCADGAVADGGKDVTQDGPTTCPSGKEPKDDPTCVSDALGIFVAPGPTGNDANAGTKASPVASLKTALQKVAGKSFIFVCEGNYTESVDIKQSASIYGGFKCADWTYSGALPKFTATKSDYVVHLDTANDTIIADLELDAIDATPNTGASSIGAFVATSQNVTFERVTIHAGKGADGLSGLLSDFVFPDGGATGSTATGGSGGAAVTVNCPGGTTTTGGAGGDIALDGKDGLPALDGGLHGDGGPSSGMGCTGGNVGAVGPAGQNGLGASVVGDFDDAGWKPASGGDGQSGSPGQGGGGGGGQVSGGNSGGGGSGGAGGCGGAGGGAGGGGGASVAVLALDSNIKVIASTCSCLVAGAGGTGIAGQPAQQSSGAHGNGFLFGCSGGNGGIGGNGGGGAGGAGGVSVGVLSKGGTINIDSATQMNITVAPQGGTKGTGAAGNDGIAGVAQPTLAL